MHQAHNIPWHILASNLAFKDAPSYLNLGEEGKNDLWPTKSPRQQKDLEHFARKIHATIKDFSKTERRKYPDKFPAPIEGRVFPEETFQRLERLAPQGINTTLSDSCAFIEYWIDAAPYGWYSTGNGDLADTVKLALLMPDQTPLLTLANHPQTPLRSLSYLSWGHSFGFEHSATDGLALYIMLNVLEATGVLARPDAKDVVPRMQVPRWAMKNMWGDWDHPLQFVPQWTHISVNPEEALPRLTDPAWSANVHDLLKELWSVMYRYDMLMAELGVDYNWTEKVLEDLRYRYRFPLELI